MDSPVLGCKRGWEQIFVRHRRNDKEQQKQAPRNAARIHQYNRDMGISQLEGTTKQAEFSFDMSAKTMEMFSLMKDAALSSIGNLSQEEDEDGTTSVEGCSLPSSSSSSSSNSSMGCCGVCGDDYLVGGSFCLDNCEDEYYARYTNDSGESASLDDDHEYEPEVEIFELEL